SSPQATGQTYSRPLNLGMRRHLAAISSGKRSGGHVPEIEGQMRKYGKGAAARRHKPGKEKNADHPGKPAGKLEPVKFGDTALASKSSCLSEAPETESPDRLALDRAVNV